MRICQAKFGVLFRYNDGKFRTVALIGVPLAFADYLRPQGWFRPVPASALTRLLRAMDVVQTADELEEADQGPSAKYGGARSLVAVPVFRKDELIGAIIIHRQEVRPFTDKQIELVKSFASQAIIAIENARLLEELRTRSLELACYVQELRALGEVGRAVSSTLDLKVVLKSIVDCAVELSNTDAGSIFYYRDDIGKFELGETAGLDADLVERTRKLDIAWRVIGEPILP